MADTLRVKIAKHGAIERKPVEDTKRQKAISDYRDMNWRVLGVPFGGPIKGRDLDGEAFHEDTEIWLKSGQEVSLTYYHGFGPDDPDSMQDKPALIGKAVYTGVDERGHWFDVHLDEEEELAQRVIDAGTDGIKASSGAVGHLTRNGLGGLIDVWPVGEIALFDTNDWRLPANDFAVIEAKTLEIPEVEAEADDAKAATVETENEPLIDEPFTVEPLEETMDEILETPVDKEVEQVDIDEKVKAAVEAALKAQPGIERGAPVHIKSGLGDPDKKTAFLHYVRTGEKIKAAMQEGTTTEGGYLVPDDMLTRIIAKRDDLSIPRRAGAMVLRTSRDVLNIPNENASLTDFTIVAEEGAISGAENENTFGQVAVTIYNFKKLIKVSEELLEDDATNLESFLNDAIARAWASTENTYSVAGSGSSAPQGILIGGTAGLTLDSASVIGAAEIPELYHKLGAAYADGAVWTMENATLGYLRGLTGNPFQFQPTPAGSGDSLMGKPVLLTDAMEAVNTTGKKSLAIGNWGYFALVERKGLSIRRLNELYAGNGQVGILANVRFGCAVLQAEAFQYATAP